MPYAFFLKPLAISFIAASILLIAAVLFNRKKTFSETRSSSRHIHIPGTSRFGGVAIILSFLIALIFDGRLVLDSPLIGIFFASILILLFGVFDDIRQLSWQTQLMLQVIAVLPVFLFGIHLQYVSNPFGGVFLLSGSFLNVLGFVLAFLWIMLLMNAMNWVDGVDGVSGGISLIASVAIFILSQRPEVNQPPIGIICMALIGTLAAFLLFNLHPSKILAGSSGAMFMGFILAILAFFAGAKIATTLLVMSVPIIDALWVIWRRWRDKVSIFSADRRHLHFSLLELGWSEFAIALLYWGLTALIAVVALSTKAQGKIVAFTLVLLLMTSFLYFVKRRIDKSKL
ncbi:MAG TPA: MraY family glycosyltransferase [Patescibacteria group bacterium]